MPLQNRVQPDGQLIATVERGLMMGNRGGRIHDPASRTLLRRRWASRRWISCVLAFRGRQRSVMGQSYTELFFTDEVVALASGHRPCFECRLAAAKAFASAMSDGTGAGHPLNADTMDRILHNERTRPRSFIIHARDLPDHAIFQLPDGTMATNHDGEIWAWSFAGYHRTKAPMTDGTMADVMVLTPPSIVAALRAGNRPVHHQTQGGRA
ncbi:MAG: hypothetical protein AAF638_07585 [Pseudomonadota bacterium]